MADEYKGLYVKFEGDTTGLTTALERVDKAATVADKRMVSVRDAMRKVSDVKVDSGWAELLEKRMGATRDAAEAQARKVSVLKDSYDQLKGQAGVSAGALDALSQQIAVEEAALASLRAELVTATEATTGLGRAAADAASAGERWSELGQGLESVGRGLTKGLTVPIVAAATASVAAAVDIDTAWYDVRKTVDATEEEYAALKDAAIELSRTEPIKATDILEAEALGAQLGVAKEALQDFALTVNQLDVATNMSVEEAATQLAQFANITGGAAGSAEQATDYYNRLASVVVHLGNNTATTEADIMNMSARFASAATMAGFSSSEIMGVATALASTGMNAEAAGSALSTSVSLVQRAVESGTLSWDEYSATVHSSTKKSESAWNDQVAHLQTFAEVSGKTVAQFVSDWQENAPKAYYELVQGMDRANREGGKLSTELQAMGLGSIRTSDAMRRLAGNVENFEYVMGLANEAWDLGKYAEIEYESRCQSLASQLQVLQNRVTATAEDVGGPLVGALLSGMDALQPLLGTVEQMASDFSALSVEQQRSTLQWVGMAAAAGPVLSMVGKVSQGIGAVHQGVSAAISGVNRFATAMRANNGELVAGYAQSKGLAARVGLLGNQYVAAAGGAEKYVDAQQRLRDAQADQEEIQARSERTALALASAQEAATATATGAAEAAQARKAAEAELAAAQQEQARAEQAVAEASAASAASQVAGSQEVLAAKQAVAEAERAAEAAASQAAAVREQQAARVAAAEAALASAVEEYEAQKAAARRAAEAAADVAAANRVERDRVAAAESRSLTAEERLQATQRAEAAKAEARAAKAAADEKREAVASAKEAVRRAKAEETAAVRQAAAQQSALEREAAAAGRAADRQETESVKRAQSEQTAAVKRAKAEQAAAAKAVEAANKRAAAATKSAGVADKTAAEQKRKLDALTKQQTANTKELTAAKEREAKATSDLGAEEGTWRTAVAKGIGTVSKVVGALGALGMVVSVAGQVTEAIGGIAASANRAAIGFDQNSRSAAQATETFSILVQSMASVQGAQTDLDIAMSASGQTISQLRSTAQEAFDDIVAIIQRDMAQAGAITSDGASKIEQDFAKIKAAASDETQTWKANIESTADVFDDLDTSSLAQYIADVRQKYADGTQALKDSYDQQVQAITSYHRQAGTAADEDLRALAEWYSQEQAILDKAKTDTIEKAQEKFDGLDKATRDGLKRLGEATRAADKDGGLLDFGRSADKMVSDWSKMWADIDKESLAGLLNVAATIKSSGGTLDEATRSQLETVLDAFDALPPELEEKAGAAMDVMVQALSDGGVELGLTSEATVQDAVDAMRDVFETEGPLVGRLLPQLLAESMSEGQWDVALSVKLLQDVAEGDWAGVVEAFNAHGIELPKGLADGMADGSIDASSASAALMAQVINAMYEADPEQAADVLGTTIDNQLAQSILTAAGMPADEAAAMVQNTVAAAQQADPNADVSQIGLGLVLSMVAGMSEGKGQLDEAASAFGADFGTTLAESLVGSESAIAAAMAAVQQAGEQGFRDAWGWHSPVPLAKTFGEDFDTTIGESIAESADLAASGVPAVVAALTEALEGAQGDLAPAGAAMASALVAALTAGVSSASGGMRSAGSEAGGSFASGVSGTSGSTAAAARSHADAAEEGVSGVAAFLSSAATTASGKFVSGLQGGVRGSSAAGRALGSAASEPMRDAAAKAGAYGRDASGNFARGVGSKASSAAASARSVASSATGPLASAGNSGYSWGSHLGANFASGVRSQVSAVAAAASAVASAAARVLRFSVPKGGPWSGAEQGGKRSGRHLAQNIAAGMVAGVRDVERAADLVGRAMTPPAYRDGWERSRAIAAAVSGDSVTYNIRIDGMTVNDDDAMRSSAAAFVGDLRRRGAMYA